MQKQVTPAMIVVALIVLVIIIGLLWYFTMGRKAAPPEDPMDMGPIDMAEPPGGEPAPLDTEGTETQ